MMNKMIKHAIYVSMAACLSAAATTAYAYDNIVRPYQSIRSSSMGGTLLTTGLYDQNFFGNPARVTANPTWKLQLPDPMVEGNKTIMDTASDIIGGGDVIGKIANSAGNINHARIQMSFPGLYLPNFLGTKMSYAFAILTSVQTDIGLRRSYQLDPAAIADVGPALTVGRKFMENDELSVGVTAAATYRMSSKAGFSLADLIKGASLSPTNSGGDGAHFDFGVGATYLLPWKPAEFDLTVGASAQNILGGKYDNLGVNILDSTTPPRVQPRSFGVGVAAKKQSLWVFSDPTLALELTDIGNNKNGSVFRLVHLGGEIRFGIITPRLGLNQGYYTAGLGLDLKVITLDVATYGEEMSLNAGGLENRIYAARLGLQI